jgi:hypothetical protein
MLLRHGASLDALITAPRVEHSPIRCAVGSNVLHIAAMVGSIGVVRLVLETQVRTLEADRLGMCRIAVPNESPLKLLLLLLLLGVLCFGCHAVVLDGWMDACMHG